MNLHQLRDSVPVLQKYTYLNTASSGVLTQQQAAWRRTQDEAFMEGASLYRDAIFQELQGVVDSLVTAFGGHSQCTALIPSYTIGMNMIAEALPKGCTVLTDSREYPSVVLPLTARGHKVSHTVLSGASLDTIMDYLQHNPTDVLAVSIVQWVDGRYFQTEYFKAIKARFPDLLIIADGTQYMGTAPFAFEGSGIDILMASAYKWLMGGYGCGFMMVSEAALRSLEISTMGNMVQIQRQVTGVTYAAQHFQPGHLDYLNFGTMKMGIDMLMDIGFDKVRKQIETLAVQAKQSLVQIGLLSEDCLGASFQTGIVHFLGSGKLVSQLAEQGILVSAREGVRISFHGYNTTSDIDTLIEALDKMS